MAVLKIAITADTWPLACDEPNLEKAPFAARELVEVIHALGAVPVILPDTEAADGAVYADLFDGLILPGGPDVSPSYFGEEPIWRIGRTNSRRDAFEKAVFQAFYEAGKPVFGICRGCQLINILLGGSVYQDLETQNPGCFICHAQKAPGGEPTHHISIAPGSLLYETLSGTAYVNSRHHQGLKTIGKGLTVTAVSPDGVAECIESVGSGQIQAVQWHPENMWKEYPSMKQLFADFLKRAENFARKNR